MEEDEETEGGINTLQTNRGTSHNEVWMYLPLPLIPQGCNVIGRSGTTEEKCCESMAACQHCVSHVTRCFELSGGEAKGFEQPIVE